MLTLSEIEKAQARKKSLSNGEIAYEISLRFSVGGSAVESIDLSADNGGWTIADLGEGKALVVVHGNADGTVEVGDHKISWNSFAGTLFRNVSSQEIYVVSCYAANKKNLKNGERKVINLTPSNFEVLFFKGQQEGVAEFHVYVTESQYTRVMHSIPAGLCEISVVR